MQRAIILCALFNLAVIQAVDASQDQVDNTDMSILVGPPAPIAPVVIARDPSGQATIRAVRINTPLSLDGVLDETAYTNTLSMSDFVQAEPLEGQPATQRTEIWLFFDDERVYVSARLWEPHMDRVVANEMRRDSFNIFSANDAFGFSFDTFYDRRNAISFTVNAIGGFVEGQTTDERQFNPDYNAVWDSSVGRFDGGWTVEAALPFKSLRYRSGRNQVWGFNARRHTPWKNETSFIVPIPAAREGFGLVTMSLAATVVGLEAPTSSRTFEIKPFVTSSVSSDLTATPSISNKLATDVGLDVKYAVTQGLTTDLTYNTDFAQVEADEQQINLTRFSLFFPEKREFFLENKGTFAFGGAGAGVGFGGGDLPILFYSRRIGLHQGKAVPINGGGRLTGRAGKYSLGVLHIQSDDDSSVGALRTNYTVARLKRDILRRSSIGALFTRRSILENGTGGNDVYGIDGAFAFFDNLVINTYWARSHTEGLQGDDTSYRAQLDYAGDRYGLQLERLTVGENFKPGIGFLRRNDMRKNYGEFRFSPRPTSLPSIRKFSAVTSLTYIENGAGRLETRGLVGEFGIEFQNSDRFSVSYNSMYELLSQPFRIAPTVTLPVGGYHFQGTRASYSFGTQRKISWNIGIGHGTFFSGKRTTINISQGRIELSPQFSVQPTLSFNWLDLPEGSFRTNLIGSRVTYTVTPRMFVSALLQYNSSGNAIGSNVRLRWEYQPGSELFVVYNEQRDTLTRGFPNLANRALIVKINRLFRP